VERVARFARVFATPPAAIWVQHTCTLLSATVQIFINLPDKKDAGFKQCRLAVRSNDFQLLRDRLIAPAHCQGAFDDRDSISCLKTAPRECPTTVETGCWRCNTLEPGGQTQGSHHTIFRLLKVRRLDEKKINSIASRRTARYRDSAKLQDAAMQFW
jgi:hypothetical protein